MAFLLCGDGGPPAMRPSALGGRHEGSLGTLLRHPVDRWAANSPIVVLDVSCRGHDAQACPGHQLRGWREP